MKFIRKAILIGTFFGSFCLVPSFLSANENFKINEERIKQLEEMGVLIPDGEVVKNTAKTEFAKTIEEQSVDTLTELAKDANTLANLVGKLYDGYEGFNREMYNYEFVVKEVQKATVLVEYENLDSEFKTIRNRAYIYLGKKALEKKQEMKAFLFFSDAYRLSYFSCVEGKSQCVRYEAEQLMKELLGITGESYVHWKK